MPRTIWNFVISIKNINAQVWAVAVAGSNNAVDWADLDNINTLMQAGVCQHLLHIVLSLPNRQVGPSLKYGCEHRDGLFIATQYGLSC